jgi:putative ABC transport system permease protein
MTRILHAIVAALASLGEHALRTTLTMLGVMFGAGAVIAMLSIGAGAEHQALALIERLGTRNIVVRGVALKPDELLEVRKKSLGLSPRDVEAIEEAVPGIAFAAPRVMIEPHRVAARGGKTVARVSGASPRQRDATPIELAEGRFLDPGDDHHHAQVCVIGAGVRRDLFGGGPALGRDVKIDDIWFEVIGVLAPDPAPTASVPGVAVSTSDHEIYVPFSTSLAKLDRDPMAAPFGEITVRLAPGTSAGETAAAIGALLDRLHSGAHDYEIVVPEALLEHSRATRRLFNLVMGLIAGISLIVGGIGIVNIMLASVLEQTREIGVRRAVGARRADIQFQFLVTAFALALLGGVLGIGLGLGIARGVATYAGWPTLVTLRSLVLSLGVSTAVGVISGFYPARRAARLDPIQALNAA